MHESIWNSHPYVSCLLSMILRVFFVVYWNQYGLLILRIDNVTLHRWTKWHIINPALICDWMKKQRDRNSVIGMTNQFQKIVFRTLQSNLISAMGALGNMKKQTNKPRSPSKISIISKAFSKLVMHGLIWKAVYLALNCIHGLFWSNEACYLFHLTLFNIEVLRRRPIHVECVAKYISYVIFWFEVSDWSGAQTFNWLLTSSSLNQEI